ncbi:BnaCnng59580D [Brassica napus]|uniref:(rape) hypothetical protein n=1 Tax=Brassica napus TaxID=3708 RepID=A0A078JSE5_BRANA|nr:unnamed protein product [Brassica napus]CDY68566.1 BnaCnng59580D [Brassica napus]
MNYRLPKVAWVHVLGKSLGKPCETSSSSDPLLLELEKINNVSTVIGLAEEYKHLVGATHSNDADFHSVVKLVQQGYKMKRSDWEQGFVDMFVATEDIGQQRKTKDEDAEHGEDLNHSEDEEEKKDEEYQKDKEQRKDKDHSMSNSEKLDKLIQMVRDLDKRVVVMQNVLGVKFNDGSPNKEDCENIASSGDRRSAQDYENEENTIDEEANSANSGDGRSALDDENEEEICDEEAKSGTEHLREEENILGENETTQKITQEEDTEKFVSESCLKQTSHVTSPTPTFNTPNFDTRVTSPTPTFTSPKFDLLSQESRHSGNGTNEVLMRDICEISVFQPLMKIKKRLVQQDSQVNEDVEPPLQKKIKADTDNKHPILHPFEKLRINHEIVTAKWFSDIETSEKSFQKRILKQFLEEIDELYDEFLGDKEVKEKYWVGVVVNLEKRSITAFNCAVMKFTDASLVPYINAYAMALPFMIRNFFKDVSMDTSMFSIKIVSEGFPQVPKIEDNGVYALKLIECHAIRIVDLAKLSEEKIAIIREKLAVDIFSELQ